VPCMQTGAPLVQKGRPSKAKVRASVCEAASALADKF